MATGQHGHSGLSVHQSVTPVSKPESGSATRRPHSMGAAAALGHTSRHETATPTPVQVLQHNPTESHGMVCESSL